ncbi:hypothetical protein E2C01_075047 [Portunus trituberculatus]|uniref:Uncharacterized protein n=1 Tax=Portunus trituberculatus TaxID=210409 RepID=A0A5B7II37_PORTR|nr:hypothetical protein [Portunus trituberculatus]
MVFPPPCHLPVAYFTAPNSLRVPLLFALRPTALVTRRNRRERDEARAVCIVVVWRSGKRGVSAPSCSRDCKRAPPSIRAAGRLGGGLCCLARSSLRARLLH